MNRQALLRLGLFQLAAGGLSVLFLGVLNRVMRVELGMDLFVVSLLVGGGHYLGALVAIPFGFYSDTHPIAGYRRTFYILAGALVTAAVLISSPWVARWLLGSIHPLKFLLGFLFFLMEGVSTYVAGTAYLALIADQTKEEERGQATGLVWTMLLIGIIATGISTSIFFAEYSFDGLVVLFVVGGVLAVIMSIIALVGQEVRRTAPSTPSNKRLSEALRTILQSNNSRFFGAFLLVSMFSFFMQDVILEPFGGEVFGLPLAETTLFNAYMGFGLIASMLLGGMVLIPRMGKRIVTEIGCWILVASFVGLASSAIFHVRQVLPLTIGFLGLGGGLFTVGGVALMMDMTSSEHAGLFVGAWTLIQAVARGPASLVSGALYSLFTNLGTSTGQGYGFVFLIEAIGLFISIIFLRRVEISEFRTEVLTLGAVATEAMD
jgi:BCD family chlorophyll transporter-like MFS transporter